MPACYYDLSNMLYGEKFIPSATATEGRIERQALGSGPQLLWLPSKEAQTLTISLDVAEAGTYHPIVVLTNSWDYGNYQLEMDGKPLGGPLDLLNTTVTDQEHVYPARSLDAGKHTFTVHNVGKKPAIEGLPLRVGRCAVAETAAVITVRHGFRNAIDSYRRCLTNLTYAPDSLTSPRMYLAE